MSNQMLPIEPSGKPKRNLPTFIVYLLGGGAALVTFILVGWALRR